MVNVMLCVFYHNYKLISLENYQISQGGCSIALIQNTTPPHLFQSKLLVKLYLNFHLPRVEACRFLQPPPAFLPSIPQVLMVFPELLWLCL